MDKQEKFFSDSIEKVQEYGQSRLMLLKLQTAEKTSKLIGVIGSVLLIAMLTSFVIIMISIMAGYFLGWLTGNLYLGFGIITALYIILLFILIKWRKQLIERLIINSVIQVFFDQSSDEKTKDVEHKN